MSLRNTSDHHWGIERAGEGNLVNCLQKSDRFKTIQGEYGYTLVSAVSILYRVPMKIVLTNQHCDNRGDESAVVGLIKSIYDYFGADSEVTLLKQTKGYTFLTEDLGVNEQPMFKNYGTIIQMMLWIILKFIHIDIRIFLSREVKNIIDLHKKADIVFSSCGGPYIGDLYINHEIIHILYCMIPLVFKKKLVFTAPSMGPFENKIMNPLRKFVLKRASLIVLRDNVSYRLATEFLNDSSKIFLTADACFAHELDMAKKGMLERKNIIGVTPLKYAYRNAENPEAEQTKYEEAIILVLNQMMTHDEDLCIEFFPQLYNKHTDIPLIKSLVERLKYSERAFIFSEKKSGVEQQIEIANMKMMIATRYHSAVFACKMNVPCVCIAYEHKAVGMMDLYGLGDCVINIHEVTQKSLEEKIKYVAENTEAIYKLLKKQNSQILAMAKRTIGLAKDAYDNKPILKIKPVMFFDDIIKNRFMCKNCGMCSAVCPTHSITFEKNLYCEFIPKLREVTCINCNKCIDACCARTIAACQLNSVFGKKISMYIAKAGDETTQKNASSGGAASVLAKYGFKQGYYNELLTVGNTNDSPCVAQPTIITDPEAVSGGSKYVSAPLCQKFNPKAFGMAATALPCQATAIKKQNHNAFVLGLFCSKATTEKLVEFMAQKSGMKAHDIEKVEYRYGIWPGHFRMLFKNGKQVSYSLNRSFFSAMYNSFLFANEGCLFCADYFCEDADISFGDPWGKAQYKEGYYGETLVIVRSEKAQRLFDEALKAGVITACSISDEEVIKGHVKEIYSKKAALKDRLKVANGGDFKIEENALFSGKISRSGNSFMEYNNRTIKKRRNYKWLPKIPRKALFIYRYANAYFLKKFIKKNQYYQYFCMVNLEGLKNGNRE